MTVEHILIPISMISVLVFCISYKRSQHGSWLFRTKFLGFQKKKLSKLCFIIIDVMVKV
jgi:hypothetical protein